tara:strand:- start:350 stop:493 length:144 start_codon:yes stop_codon:yes gene_type:complete
MWKKLINIINKIKCKINCCYQSQCSLNENKIDEDIIDEVAEDSEEFK